MNEISTAPDGQPSAQISGGIDPLKLHALMHSRLRESPAIDQIAPALVRASGMMTSPRRNRSVEVTSRRTGAKYTFKYATLDKINDMLRQPLSENGLVLMTPVVAGPRGPAVLAKLLHASGQWMECEIPLVPPSSDEPGPQAFGSSVSYIRRYAVCALLNIAGDEDDDGNRAEGNHVQDRRAARAGRGAGPIPELADGHRDTVFQMLVRRARAAEDVGLLDDVLRYWLDQRAGIERTRDAEPEAWEFLEAELTEAIRRRLNVVPAAVFATALRATQPAHLNVLESKLAGKWADTLANLAADLPETHALLMRHVEGEIARVDAAHPRLPLAGPAADPRPEPPPAPPPAPEPQMEPQPQPQPPGAFQLRDEHGEAAAPPDADPTAFARAYAAAWRAARTQAARDNLAHHNADELAEAMQDRAARVVLDELGAEAAGAGAAPEDLVVHPPLANGRLAVAAYVTAVGEALARLGPGRIEAWERANRPVFLGDGMPLNTGKRVVEMLNARRAAFALPPIGGSA